MEALDTIPKSLEISNTEEWPEHCDPDVPAIVVPLAFGETFLLSVWLMSSRILTNSIFCYCRCLTYSMKDFDSFLVTFVIVS